MSACLIYHVYTLFMSQLPKDSRNIIIPMSNNNKRLITFNDINLKFFKEHPQKEYWIYINELISIHHGNKYYFVNLHPKPIQRYACISILKEWKNDGCEKFYVVIEYLKLKKSVNFGKLIIPDVHWFLPVNLKDESVAYKPSKLSKKILNEWKKITEDEHEIIWIKKHLADSIPTHLMIPKFSDYDKNPINTIVKGYIHNLQHGKSVFVKETDHVQHKYWFPFFYDYDNPIKIYLINLHLKPKYLFGVYSINSACTGFFKPLQGNDIYRNMIPYHEKLIDGL